MQRGIGRTGHLLLALVLFALGAFGLMLGTIAFRQGLVQFYYIGISTTAVALLALFAIALLAPLSNVPLRFKRPAKANAAEPAPPTPAPVSATASAPAAVTETFEYDQFDPAPKAAPVEMVLPQAFKGTTPPAPTPHAAGMVTFQASPAARTAPAANAPAATTPRTSPSVQPPMSKEWPQRRKAVPRPGQAPAPDAGPAVRPELTERYTRTTPTVRRMLDAETPAEKPQEHVADRAPLDMNTDFVAPGMSIGRCGQCKCLLLAPDARPIRLKCPECAKVTLLE